MTKVFVEQPLALPGSAKSMVHVETSPGTPQLPLKAPSFTSFKPVDIFFLKKYYILTNLSQVSLYSKKTSPII